MMQRLFLLLMFALWAQSAIAQTPDYIRADNAAIRNAFGAPVASKIFSDAYTPMRRDMVQKSAQRIPTYDCGKEPLMALAFVIPFPIKPGAVSWVERIVVDCKPRTQRNFLAIMEGGGPRMIELLPGTSQTDPVLQRDAFTGSSAAVAGVKPQGCDKQWVIDTRISGERRANAPWSEIWSYDLCGKRADVEMTFTPSPQRGTTWNAKLVK
jgi:hypothetical protein